jgi:hypothetical protein
MTGNIVDRNMDPFAAGTEEAAALAKPDRFNATPPTPATPMVR